MVGGGFRLPAKCVWTLDMAIVDLAAAPVPPSQSSLPPAVLRDRGGPRKLSEAGGSPPKAFGVTPLSTSACKLIIFGIFFNFVQKVILCVQGIIPRFIHQLH